MAEFTFTKIIESLATPLVESIELSEDAFLLLKNETTPANYLQLLLDNGFYTDAIIFLANSLPKREAVWWACICARQTLNDKSPVNDIKAIESAEAWVYKPVQAVCELTYATAKETKLKTSAGWAAMSAFWSGENMSPSKKAIVPPSDDLTGKAVNGAVILSAVLENEPKKITENYQLFLEKGIEIACGGDGR